jgi:hypothetical protein
MCITTALAFPGPLRLPQKATVVLLCAKALRYGTFIRDPKTSLFQMALQGMFYELSCSLLSYSFLSYSYLTSPHSFDTCQVFTRFGLFIFFPSLSSVVSEAFAIMMWWVKALGLAMMPAVVHSYAATDSPQDAVRTCQ